MLLTFIVILLVIVYESASVIELIFSYYVFISVSS